MKKKSGPKQVEETKGVLHAEWFPAYGVRFREIPHVVVIGATYGKAMQNLARFGYNQRRDHHVDYDIVFVNEPFEVD